jgi:predicted porin
MGTVIPLGLGAIKLTWLRGDQTGATAAQSANDANLVGAGYVYSLSKRTALYGQVAQVSNKGTAVFAIPGGPAVSATATASNYFGGQKSTGFEAGMRHDF